jgi:hypothetical protein
VAVWRACRSAAATGSSPDPGSPAGVAIGYRRYEAVDGRVAPPSAAAADRARRRAVLDPVRPYAKWLNFYASDYGGLGVVMAIFFWVAFSSAVIVVAASLAPAFAHRRSIRAPG